MSLPRTFARVRSLDVACPHCGRMAILNATTRITRRMGQMRPKADEWDPLTGKWRCRGCGKTMSIGIVIWKWPGRSGMDKHPPGDRIPTPAESLQLRAIVPGVGCGTGSYARGNVVHDGPVDEDPVLPPRKLQEDAPFELMRDLAAEDDEADETGSESGR